MQLQKISLTQQGALGTLVPVCTAFWRRYLVRTFHY